MWPAFLFCFGTEEHEIGGERQFFLDYLIKMGVYTHINSFFLLYFCGVKSFNLKSITL